MKNKFVHRRQWRHFIIFRCCDDKIFLNLFFSDATKEWKKKRWGKRNRKIVREIDRNYCKWKREEAKEERLGERWRKKHCRNTWNDSVCCVITGKNERKRERERKDDLLAGDWLVIPVQTCVRPVCRLAVRWRALMLWYVLMLDYK